MVLDYLDEEQGRDSASNTERAEEIAEQRDIFSVKPPSDVACRLLI